MAFDEEELDPHGECRHEIHRLTQERNEARQLLWLLVYSFSDGLELNATELQSWPGYDRALLETCALPSGVVKVRAAVSERTEA